MESKVCNECGKLKQFTCFYKHPKGKVGGYYWKYIKESL